MRCSLMKIIIVWTGMCVCVPALITTYFAFKTKKINNLLLIALGSFESDSMILSTIIRNRV